jgi:hypothetical protein
LCICRTVCGRSGFRIGGDTVTLSGMTMITPKSPFVDTRLIQAGDFLRGVQWR